ncbi:MAG: alpha/beta hydrolase [Desulfobacterales bacterium]
MKKAVIILLALLLLAPVAVYFFFPGVLYSLSMTKARNDAALEKKSITINDHEIVYLEGGTGDTILLVHGFTADKDNWTRMAKLLTPDYHVVALDLPGFGESTKIQERSYTIASQVLRLNQFVSALQLSRFHIAGNSMGGAVSGRYTAHFPEKVVTLGLFNTGGVSSCEKSELRKRIENGENPLLIETPEQYDSMLEFVFVRPPAIPGPVKKYLIKNAMAAKDFNEKIMGDLAGENYSLEGDLADIKAHTLILWGDKDRLIDVSCVKPLQNGISNAATIIMEDCGHLPMLERPEETARHYRSFLKAAGGPLDMAFEIRK